MCSILVASNNLTLALHSTKSYVLSHKFVDNLRQQHINTNSNSDSYTSDKASKHFYVFDDESVMRRAPAPRRTEVKIAEKRRI